MRVALISACYGQFDPINPLPVDHGFDDAVLVSDYRYSATEAPGWRVVVEPRGESPRLAAKRPKMLPWLFTDCDAAVWLDASFEVVDGGFSWWARQHLAVNDFVVWAHPEGRLGLEQEAAVCWDWEKYAGCDLRGQVAEYQRDGMPVKWGLFAAGTVGWVFTPEAKRFGSLWFGENERWSIQDQVSLPYLLWREGKRFGVWSGNEYRNPFVRLRWDQRPNRQA